MAADSAGGLEVRLLLEGLAPGAVEEDRIEAGFPEGAGREEEREQKGSSAVGPGCRHGSSIDPCRGKANAGRRAGSRRPGIDEKPSGRSCS